MITWKITDTTSENGVITSAKWEHSLPKPTDEQLAD